MANGETKKVVLSVGGSLIVPNGGINIAFLKKLNIFVREQLAKHNRQFFLVIGGGSTARHYRDAGRDVVSHELTRDDLDWLGIHATRLNAHLLRTIFQDIAHASIINHYDVIRKPDEPVVIAAGWKPGWSTDYCAILLCEDYRAHTMINLSNISQVYDKDPREYPDAKPIEKISWSDYRKLIGYEWTPGLNSPFDPLAAKKAQEIGAKVVILNGEDFANLERCLNKEPFVGTVIE